MASADETDTEAKRKKAADTEAEANAVDDNLPPGAPDDIIAGPDAAPVVGGVNPQIMNMTGVQPTAAAAPAAAMGGDPMRSRMGFGMGGWGQGMGWGQGQDQGQQGGMGGMMGGPHHGWLQQIMQRIQQARAQREAQRAQHMQQFAGSPFGQQFMASPMGQRMQQGHPDWFPQAAAPAGGVPAPAAAAAMPPTAAAQANAQATQAQAPAAAPAPAAAAPAPQQPQAPSPERRVPMGVMQRQPMQQRPTLGSGGMNDSIAQALRNRMGGGGMMGGGRRQF